MMTYDVSNRTIPASTYTEQMFDNAFVFDEVSSVKAPSCRRPSSSGANVN